MTTGTPDDLAHELDRHRAYLGAVAYRMLGSYADAEDAVQEAWLRLAGADTSGVDDLRAWLTRVVSRICLDQLRARGRRHEDPLGSLPDLEAGGADPSARAEVTERVGYALMLVLDQLDPDERLAYVLHDIFGMPFDEVAGIVARTPAAARKLASRARQRLRGGDPDSASDTSRQQRRAVVEAFLAASRSGDFDALVGVLHPDVEFRIDQGSAGVQIVRGAEQVATGAARYRAATAGYEFDVVALGDGFGILSSKDGVPTSVLLFTSEGDHVVSMESRLLG